MSKYLVFHENSEKKVFHEHSDSYKAKRSLQKKVLPTFEFNNSSNLKWPRNVFINWTVSSVSEVQLISIDFKL